MKNKAGKIKRQSKSNRFVHWLTAGSIFLLIFSGLGQLPLYHRYMVTEIPFMGWTGNYFATLVLHYLGAIILLFIVFYHIILHLIRKEFSIWPRKGDVKESIQIIKAMFTKGQEPPSDKYLAEQRLAYLFIGLNVMLLVVTGIIKLIKNVPRVSIANGVITWSAHIHNFATVFLIIGIIAHLAAFIIKANRKLLPGMFTGYVDEEYVKHRHPIWYKKLSIKKSESK